MAAEPAPHTDDRLASPGQVLEVVRRLATELKPQAPPPAVTLDSALDADLAIDSLGRVELLTRLERAFGVNLPEEVLVAAQTPRDLLAAVQAASPAPAAPLSRPAPAAAPVTVAAAPETAGTLLEVLDWHVRAHPERIHIHLVTAQGAEENASYADLAQGAARIAQGLLARGLQPGQTVALMLPTSRDYFYSFFGVLAAGLIPVPIYPPLRPAQIEEHLRRHARILENAQARMLITVPEARAAARLLRLQVEGLASVVTADELGAPLAAVPPPAFAVAPQDIALLQYTSGSTGDPKGVVLTHANLLANIRAMGAAVQASSADTFVSWMPLYHDMGLIGAWLGSLYYGMPLVVMSPLTFLAHPLEWLRAIHRHRATLSGAPNFGYELCLKRVEDRDLEELDLSSWRFAFNGAEPVSPDTVARFAARFAPCGLRPETMAPVYGLAECSVGLAFPPPGRAPVVDRVRRDAFLQEGRALPAAGEDATALRFVACGRALPGHEIRIVDDTGHEAGEREQGRIEFRGPSATSGYFRNPPATRRLIHDGWLDTGDLGYFASGELYVTGRVKDVIIRAGRNVHPQELEETVGNLPGIRKGCVAVFGSRDPAAATEKLVVLAETREAGEAARARLTHAINALAVELIGMPPDEVVLAAPHTVLKTSSGKIRRAASRELYEQGRLGAPARAVWQQVLRLAWAGLGPQRRRLARAAATLAWAAWAWLLFWLLAPLVWFTVALLPRPAASLPVIRAAARLLVWLSRTPVEIEGREHLPAVPYVLVANHASYADGILLTAVLPGMYRYVAKRELLANPVARLFLRHTGAAFVERFEHARGIEDARLLARAARDHTLVFFPEGTFTRTPGLRPFHLGAFAAAAEAGAPVVPVAIRGARALLRAGQWFPRRAAVRITIGAPLRPEGSGWRAALKLRDAARAHILAHGGEPDLAAVPVTPVS